MKVKKGRVCISGKIIIHHQSVKIRNTRPESHTRKQKNAWNTDMSSPLGEHKYLSTIDSWNWRISLFPTSASYISFPRMSVALLALLCLDELQWSLSAFHTISSRIPGILPTRFQRVWLKAEVLCFNSSSSSEIDHLLREEKQWLKNLWVK